jgi:hypothetical protein
MKIKTVTYSMLRVTKQFENDRAEVTVELGPNDDPGKAFDAAKKECLAALHRCNGCPR